MSGKLFTPIDLRPPTAKTVREVELERLLEAALPHLHHQFSITGNLALSKLIEGARKVLK